MDFISFQGTRDVFSNMYPCKLRKYNKTFNSAEHLYQYEKCLFHKSEKLGLRVYNSNNGFIAKRHAKEIKVSPSWLNYREECLKNILTLKAEQCEKFRKHLHLSKDKMLIEANKYDNYWGCGLDKSALSISNGIYQGKNKMGELLMILRSELIAETVHIVY
jgi:ribA/ribD-fused uncharacterized protein